MMWRGNLLPPRGGGVEVVAKELEGITSIQRIAQTRNWTEERLYRNLEDREKP